MNFFELESIHISSLSDSDLREFVARLCEAELIQQGLQPSCVTWGGAQEAADGGLDISVKNAAVTSNASFVARENTGIQVKKNTMGKAACAKEMLNRGKIKTVIQELAAKKGAYIIVSGKDDCSEKMLIERISGMKSAVKSLHNKEDLHLDFYGRDRLANWLRRHPSVALWVRSRLGKPLAGWKPYGRWALTPPEQDDQFLVDDHPCVIDANSTSKELHSIANGIQMTREKLREAGSTVRITGLSGVGKTRFAQALFETDFGHHPLPASDVIYADLGSDLSPTASELVNYLIANDFSTYLVLDNCPPDVHRNLQKQVSSSGAKLRLLTVEYDISDDKPEETEVIQIEAVSERIVSKLVQKRFPHLGQTNADRISEFSGGNARVALALSSRVDADETLAKFSDEDLFQKLFAQRKGASADLLRSAEALALTYSFNVSRLEFNDELNVLGNISTTNRQDLYRGQAELIRRQLAQQRGDWRAVLPHALANRLAKRALENISPEDINSEIFKTENFRLFQSFAHRLGYLHDFEPARKLASTWIQAGAPLHDLNACNEKNLIALNYVAPVFPEVILSAIEAASLNPTFASRSNRNFNRFVRLLCHLAYEDNTFDRAAAVLLKFAETEKKGENNNSIVGQMRQLFSLRLSGTEAKPERRQQFVDRLLKSENPRHREIADQLLQSAFQSNRWTSFADFHFGARKRGPGWAPKDKSEAIAWYVGHIRLLDQFFNSSCQRDHEWARALLADNFRGLWSFAHCFDALEQNIRIYGQNGNWPEIWIPIKKTIHFDGARHTPELLARLEALERFSAPANPYSEIEAYVLSDVWDHVEINQDAYEEAAQVFNEKIISLGTLAASEPAYLSRLGPKLWETQTQTLFIFGKGLAAGTSKPFELLNILVTSFKETRSERKGLQVLGGYIRGIHDKDPHQARQILEFSLDVPELHPYSVILLTTIPVVSWVSKKLIELARERRIPAFRFEVLSYGRAHEGFLDFDLAALLSEINELDRGYLSVIEILSMRFYQMGAREYFPDHEIRAVARDSIRRLFSASRSELENLRSHGIERVLEEALGPTAPQAEIKSLIKIFCKGLEDYRLYAYEMSHAISFFIKCYPELLLDVAFDGKKKEPVLTYLLFRDRGGRISPSLNEAPVDRLLHWCGGDQSRIMKISKAVDAYSSREQSPMEVEGTNNIVLSVHIKSLMEVTTDKLAMVEVIFNAARPDSWSNSLANILEARSAAFAELLEHPIAAVQSLARHKLELLEQSVLREREREAAEANDREQRFE